MRRGTEAAVWFGNLVHDLRIKQNLTMRQLGDLVGVPAATVSQVEKAQRAVKEPKLALWAAALQVDDAWLRNEWQFLEEKYPEQPVVRRRGKSSTTDEFLVLCSTLTAPERERVKGYIHRLLEERAPKEA